MLGFFFGYIIHKCRSDGFSIHLFYWVTLVGHWLLFYCRLTDCWQVSMESRCLTRLSCWYRWQLLWCVLRAACKAHGKEFRRSSSCPHDCLRIQRAVGQVG